ncbi:MULTISPECIES: porin [unclassified Marinobacter]|jgi:predicted porin|uniref:porin n=1 Tax=unclassified Marinobacter TaxID=83889 RepID=UPI0020101437|nr:MULTISPECIES: porin [unclassified Marinobacter]MCL1476419.1 porin [Marinobacter sp.]MCL1481018.1 porin [Marinobacter sp.]MCL1483572.1 porin [Marinobacter sp.]MCL1486674.1 porin [Marinobacter sp.]UQG56787.1 porin [Marinobacter sp. M4C]
MKKTLIASAIAAISFSGAVAAQATLNASEMAEKMDAMPQVYGNIQLVTTYDDVKDGANSTDFADNGSTIGVKHDHLIAPGITGFFKAELEFNADDKAGNKGLDSFDEAYIGVKGDSFGQVWIGSDDSTFERAVEEISNFWEVATLSLSGSYDTGEGDLVQYMTPSFGGMTLGAAVQINGNDKAGGKSYPYQLSAVYAVDALELAIAMDSNDGASAYSKRFDPAVASTQSVNNENTYGLRASYTLDNLRLTGQFQTRKNVRDSYGLMGVYTLGQNQFALSYEVREKDGTAKTGNNTTDTIAIQALRNLSDNLYVYAEGYLGGGDDVYDTGRVDGTTGSKIFSDERTVAAVGATYYF